MRKAAAAAAAVLQFASLCCVAAAPHAADKIRIDEAGNFVDGFGRVRIFHGINSVEKGPPWYSQSIRNASLLSLYEQWGFNAVRLGAMWAGVEPLQDTVNATYLAVIAGIVDSLAARGIYTILDMHQDVLTTKYKSYDGVPRWLIDKFPASPRPYPWPVHRVSSWAEGYLTWAVSSAFQHLYSNTSAAWSRWGKFWTEVADAVSGQPLVLGYELINEPWAGDIYSDPMLVLPGPAGSKNLQPVYDFLAELIGRADPDGIVFYEPVTWALAIGGKGLTGTGFTQVPAGRKRHSCLSFHYYCWLLSNNPSVAPYPIWEQLACDAVLLQRTFSGAAATVRDIGGAKFLTEFGLCAPNARANSSSTIECDAVLEKADEWQVSWTYWDSRFVADNGSIMWDTVRSFARPYPMATAGQPIRYHFDLASARFEFQFKFNSSIAAATEVFVPVSVHYKSGMHVSISSGFNYTISRHRILISPAAPNCTTGRAVRLIVTRR